MNIKVVYSDELSVDHAHSFSPSANKPKRSVDSWISKGLPIDLIVPNPVTLDEVCAVHDEEFVRRIQSGEIDNGFGPEILKSPVPCY
jgi:acetoin utilization deacetylase AcuC-like enzyme